MLRNYDESFAHVLQYEGGYVNHPSDPGGPTNKGVTQRVYDALRLSHGAPKQSVRRITEQEVAAIYSAQYWRPVVATLLPSGVDLCTFDGVVNSGVRQGTKWLQRAVGVDADGIVGVLTISAAREQDASLTMNRMCDQRMAFLRRLKHWPKFGKGWTTRVAATRKKSLALVNNDEKSVVL